MPNESPGASGNAAANPNMPNESTLTIANSVSELKAYRETIGGLLARARGQDAEGSALRRGGKSSEEFDFALAQTIVEIRTKLNAGVDLLEKVAGENWTPGLRAIHFVRELRSAQATLAAQGVIFDRFEFVIEQITAEVPNDGSSPVAPAAAL